MSNIAAAIITIGDELLIGQTIDTNSAWIAQRLNQMGIEVLRRVAVGDTRQAILQALDTELANASLVIMTGGLGPTADDITKPLLNEYFGGQMRIDEKVEAHVKNLFTRRNKPFLDRNRKQAEVPDNCTVLFNAMGTAPGMWFQRGDKVVIALPGVPFEMAGIMEQEALPRLRQHFVSDALLHKSIITAGEGESFIADKIEDLETTLPAHIKLAYLPGAGMVKLRLTGRGKDSDVLAAELQQWQQAIATRLSDIVVGLEDLPMEEINGKWFADNNATIGLAESCTGGCIAHHLTQVPGASAYFKGSIVCYDPTIKVKLLGVPQTLIDTAGTISEAVAVAMAKGALEALEVDYALAITGLLGPVGEDASIPVGTVWIAVGRNGEIKTRKFLFHYDRVRNKEMAVSMALLMLWKFVNGKLS